MLNEIFFTYLLYARSFDAVTKGGED